VSRYDVILSLHILAAVFGFAVAGAAHSTMFRLRGATDMSQVRSHLAVLNKVGMLFGIAALLLLVFGADLIHLSSGARKVHWGDGWILTSLVSLIVVEAIGGIVIGRGVKAISRKLESTPAGPVTADTRALLADRPIWLASHATTAVMASIVFVMVGKPSTTGAIVTVLIGAVVGAVSALPFTKPAAVAS
jgi:Predicted integral membrane protein (DUF2269)